MGRRKKSWWKRLVSKLFGVSKELKKYRNPEPYAVGLERTKKEMEKKDGRQETQPLQQYHTQVEVRKVSRRIKTPRGMGGDGQEVHGLSEETSERDVPF